MSQGDGPRAWLVAVLLALGVLDGLDFGAVCLIQAFLVALFWPVVWLFVFPEPFRRRRR